MLAAEHWGGALGLRPECPHFFFGMSGNCVMFKPSLDK